MAQASPPPRTLASAGAFAFVDETECEPVDVAAAASINLVSDPQRHPSVTSETIPFALGVAIGTRMEAKMQ